MSQFLNHLLKAKEFMLYKLKQAVEFGLEYAEFRPDLSNLIYAVRMRGNLAGMKDATLEEKKKIAEDFLELDLQDPWKNPKNEHLAKQMLNLEKINSPEDIKRIKYLVGLNNNGALRGGLK